MIELQWEIPACIDDLEAFLNEVAEACFKVEGIEGAGFCIRIVDDAAIQELNNSMRGIDKPTVMPGTPVPPVQPEPAPKGEMDND